MEDEVSIPSMGTEQQKKAEGYVVTPDMADDEINNILKMARYNAPTYEVGIDKHVTVPEMQAAREMRNAVEFARNKTGQADAVISWHIDNYPPKPNEVQTPDFDTFKKLFIRAVEMERAGILRLLDIIIRYGAIPQDISEQINDKLKEEQSHFKMAQNAGLVSHYALTFSLDASAATRGLSVLMIRPSVVHWGDTTLEQFLRIYDVVNPSMTDQIVLGVEEKKP